MALVSRPAGPCWQEEASPSDPAVPCWGRACSGVQTAADIAGTGPAVQSTLFGSPSSSASSAADIAASGGTVQRIRGADAGNLPVHLAHESAADEAYFGEASDRWPDGEIERTERLGTKPWSRRVSEGLESAGLCRPPHSPVSSSC